MLAPKDMLLVGSWAGLALAAPGATAIGSQAGATSQPYSSPSSAIGPVAPNGSGQPVIGTPASNMTGPYPAPVFTNSSLPSVMAQINADSEFDFVLKTYLSFAESGGANTAEVLRAASQIAPGEFESFYQEFKYLGDQILNMTSSSRQGGHKVSLRNALFRVSSYYRAADFFLHGNQSDPRIYELWDSQLAAFNEAASLLDVPVECFNVSTPYGFSIPGRVFKPVATNETRPTIVVGNGYDGSQEDSYHSICPQALARGYNCITYEGPGQPVVRRNQNKGFIVDWWKVITPLTDYVLSRPDVDKNKMALLGISYGAQITPLAATKEHRYQAVLSVDGLFDLGSVIQSDLPPEAKSQFAAGQKSQFDATMNQLRTNPEVPTQLRWLINQGLFAWDTLSAYEWLTQLKAASLANRTGSITNPLLATQGQDDSIVGNQTQILLDAMQGRADYHLFKTEVGAGEHCQLGAEAQLAQVMFDWTDKQFARGGSAQNSSAPSYPVSAPYPISTPYSAVASSPASASYPAGASAPASASYPAGASAPASASYPAGVSAPASASYPASASAPAAVSSQAGAPSSAAASSPDGTTYQTSS